MTTTIYSLWDNGHIEEIAEYSLEPKKALIAFLQQTRGNYNTMDYPSDMVGIYKRLDRFYYVDIANNRTIGAIQK